MSDAYGTNIIGKGWRFPPQIGPNGSIALVGGETEIEQAILIILRTAPGQRFDLQYYELRDRWRIIPIPGCQSSDPHVEDKEVQP